MVIKLQILLDKAEPTYTSIYSDMQENINNYRLLNIGRKKQIMKIGRDNIPKKGSVDFFDNNFYEPGRGYIQPSSDTSKRILIKEFDSAKRNESMAIIEEVRDLRYLGNMKIELTIQRYLIKEK